MFIHYILIIEILYLYLCKNVQGGWVDIPEFSDEMKVYRTPLSIREHRYKFMQDNNFFHKQDSIISEEQADIKIPSIQYEDVNVTRLSVSESSLETNNYFPNISDKDIDEHSCDVNNKSYEMVSITIINILGYN